MAITSRVPQGTMQPKTAQGKGLASLGHQGVLPRPSGVLAQLGHMAPQLCAVLSSKNALLFPM